jgi:hypothetical protein
MTVLLWNAQPRRLVGRRLGAVQIKHPIISLAAKLRNVRFRARRSMSFLDKSIEQCGSFGPVKTKQPAPIRTYG